ncbi:terminase large subunit domain-containing protein [Desulforegula conservatrix]|uniref:terminase large subunit domain-containing protein n=1 Tax=Desulforegula conservatrix TaxID=153026 RepID=UPI00040ABAE0|nr:terminase family protein [Desulforegula conservatrix]
MTITEITDPLADPLVQYQKAWAEDQSEVAIIEKSRRTGISWTEAGITTLEASAKSGMNAWYIGYNKDMAYEFILYCAWWAKLYNLAAGEIEETEEVFKDGDESKSILSFVIRFDSGWRITALSSRPANLRGKQGRVIIDEAAFHEQLGELLKAAMALLMWGGKVRIISTHNGVDNEFNEVITEVRSGKKPYSLHRVTLDEALEDGIYKRICIKLGKEWSPEAETRWRQNLIDFYGDASEEELFCVPSKSGGTYLPIGLIEARMNPDTPVVRIERTDAFALLPESEREADIAEWCEEMLLPLLSAIPETVQTVFGEDFARNGDLTVVTPLMREQDLRLRPPFMLEMRNIPFHQQAQILFFIVDRLPGFLGGVMDARGNGQYLAEVAAQRYGAGRIIQLMLSEGWYLENMPPFKAALEDGSIYGIPADKDILADMRAFKVVRGVARIPEKRTTDAEGNKRHGDAGVSLALAHSAARSGFEAECFDYRSVKSVISRTDSRWEEEPEDWREVKATAGFMRGAV